MLARTTAYDSDESSDAESNFAASFEALADAEAELQSLLERKGEIDRYLATIERTIYSVETSYLQNTQSGGNLVSSTDAHSNGFNRVQVKERGIRDEDRLFSCSSLTYLEALSSGNSEFLKPSYTPLLESAKIFTDCASPNLSKMYQTLLTSLKPSLYAVPHKYKTRGRPSLAKKMFSSSTISTSSAPYFSTKTPSPGLAFKRELYEKSDPPTSSCSLSPEPLSYAGPIKRICLGRNRKDIRFNNFSTVGGDVSCVVQVPRLSSPILLPFDRRMKDEEDD